jgi:hypothetical protein
MAQAEHGHCRRLLMLRGESTARRHNRQPRRATPRIQCPLQCRRSLILPPQYSSIVNMARAVRTTPHHGRTACNYFSGCRVAQLQHSPRSARIHGSHVQLWQHKDGPQIGGTGDTLAGGAHRPCVMSPPARPTGLGRRDPALAPEPANRRRTRLNIRERHLPNRLCVRSCNLLIKPSAPPVAMIDANSSRRVARSLMVPLR